MREEEEPVNLINPVLVMTSSSHNLACSENTHMSLFFLLFLLPVVSSVNFQISSFHEQTTNIVYEGDASSSVGAVEFNNVDYTCHLGWATYKEKVPIWDSDSGKVTDFTTRFSFTIDTQGSARYGSGLAFFLAPETFSIPPNSAGGFLGLFNTTTSDSPSNQMVVVEFDSHPDSWDPAYEHVGININSISSAVTAPWNASLHSRDTADVLITYNSTTKNLSVSWSYKDSPALLANSSLSYVVDLTKVLPERAKVGFSAATGMLTERHTLEAWEFSSSLHPRRERKSTKEVKLILGLTIPVGILILGLIVSSFILWKRKHAKKQIPEMVNLTSINNDLERGAGPRRFSHVDLASATDNFSEERKLGEGGFGCVYKGYFSNLDMMVAVKKISRQSKQGKKEYVTEVKTISQLRHRNLVQLIGWCHDRGEFLLVYEFMPNRSLDVHLFGKRSPLIWAVRYKIALGLASALLYLHEEWEQCVVHRDIKASNVMLDSSFGVKLGDFGLARLMDHELGPQTTGLAGTFGYLAPEYISTGKASKASDVYSFGVVLLEIVTGRKSVDPMDIETQMGLVEWVWELYGRGMVVSAADEKLGKSFDEKEMECLMIVGLWCAHPDRSLRPSIRQAIQVLHFERAVPDLPAKMPVPTYHVPYTPPLSSGEPMITTTSYEVGR